MRVAQARGVREAKPGENEGGGLAGEDSESHSYVLSPAHSPPLPPHEPQQQDPAAGTLPSGPAVVDISLNCMYGTHIRKIASGRAPSSQSEAANHERVAAHVRRFLHLHSSFLLTFRVAWLTGTAFEPPPSRLCAPAAVATVEPRKVRWVDD